MQLNDLVKGFFMFNHIERDGKSKNFFQPFQMYILLTTKDPFHFFCTLNRYTIKIFITIFKQFPFKSKDNRFCAWNFTQPFTYGTFFQ